MLKGNFSDYTALKPLIMGLGVFPDGLCPVQSHTKTFAQTYNPYVDFQ